MALPTHAAEEWKEAQLDHEEMVQLIAQCRSSSLVQKLQPWLTSKTQEMKKSSVGGACLRAVAVDIRVDAELDHQEMSQLVAQCPSRRLKQELQPWLTMKAEEMKNLSLGYSHLADATDAHAEAELDHEEMTQLVARCRSSRIRRELEPWVVRKTEQRRISPIGGASLPTIVIVGAPGVGKRRLMWALAGKSVDTNQTSAREAEVLIVTKYYMARARCCVVDIEEQASLENVSELLHTAHAVIFVWSERHAMSFKDVCGCLSVSKNDAGVEYISRHRVQLCVGVCVSCAENLSPVKAEAASWSLDNGFEHLHCSLEDADLDVLRARMVGGLREQRGSLLESDEATISRVADAIECHAWPSSGPPRPVKESMTDSLPAVISNPQDNPPGAALVVVVGVSGVGHRDLVKALVGSELDLRGCGEVFLKTKYYNRRLRFQVIDLDVKSHCTSSEKDSNAQLPSEATESSSTLSLIKAAEGVLLVCDALRPETFTRVQQVYDAACPLPSEDKLEEYAESMEAVQLCLAIDSSGAPERLEGDAANEDDPLEHVARMWCADHFFEYLSCPLREEDLKRVRKRWSSGSRNASLLSMDDDSDSAERIVEALECHTWKDIDLKDDCDNLDHDGSNGGSLDNATEATEVVNGSAKHGKGKQDVGNEQAVEMMEHFTEAIKKVRDMPDDAHRRERAAEIATRMAKSMGLDSDDDDDDQ